MKSISIMLALLLALAPFQAHACGMASASAAAPQVGMNVEDGHAGHSGDHDCCAGEAPAEPPACDASGACDHCVVGTSAVPVYAEATGPMPVACLTRLAADDLAPSHASPPFRPPAEFS